MRLHLAVSLFTTEIIWTMRRHGSWKCDVLLSAPVAFVSGAIGSLALTSGLSGRYAATETQRR
jgi:hypothetical protein